MSADHGGFVLKEQLAKTLRQLEFDIVDFGALQLTFTDDYPDYFIPLSQAVAAGGVDRGIAICGSGVGASIVANKVAGVRASVMHDVFSARQGVEDDDVNVLCLGGRVIGTAIAAELVRVFLAARFSGAERHIRRLAKVAELESGNGEV